MHEKQPLVTIIVPAFNSENTIEESLDSILNQKYSNLEIIVVNDASTDSTPEILESYGDRIVLIRNQTNLGIYGTMNAGIQSSQGKYIAVYHADDVYEPTIVEQEVGFFEQHPDVGAVFSKDIFIDEEGIEYNRLVLPSKVPGGVPLEYRTVLNGLLLYRNRFIRCPSCMVRRSVYEDVGLYAPDKFYNTSDLEMYLRISEKYSLGIVDEYLFRYRHTKNQSSSRYHHLRIEEERFFVIMDLYLEKSGRPLASTEALSAYAAHRSEDELMRAISLYILNRGTESRELLRAMNPGRFLRSGNVQRFRLILLYLIMTVLVVLPRIATISNLFYRRWHTK